MDENVLIATAAVLISIAFNWLPKLKDWYTVQDDNAQRLIMLGVLALSAGVVFGASCTGFQIPGIVYSGTCDTEGAKALGQLFINAVAVNQVAFLVLPKPK